MTGPGDGDKEEEEIWEPKDPAPSRPWGKRVDPGDLVSALMVVADLDSAQASTLAAAVIETAASKLRPSRRQASRRRVHIQMANGVRFDILVAAPPQQKKRRLRMGGTKGLPPGTTFLFARPNSKIKPSDGAKVRIVPKGSSEIAPRHPEFEIDVEPARSTPRVLASRLRLHG